MQGHDKIRGWDAWSTFLWLPFTPGTYQQYAEFLKEQGFENFVRIPSYTMRHRIGEALVQQFNTEMATFHLSCGEYAILLLDWTAILGIKFGGFLIPTDEISFEMASELLGISLPLTVDTRGYFRPIASPQIRTEWLQSSIPLGVAPTNILLWWFFLWFLCSCFFGNNRSILTCQLLWAMKAVSNIGRYD